MLEMDKCREEIKHLHENSDSIPGFCANRTVIAKPVRKIPKTGTNDRSPMLASSRYKGTSISIRLEATIQCATNKRRIEGSKISDNSRSTSSLDVFRFCRGMQEEVKYSYMKAAGQKTKAMSSKFVRKQKK